MHDVETGSLSRGDMEAIANKSGPSLLLAYAPKDAAVSDNVPLSSETTVGRAKSCSLCIQDITMSRKHFKISKNDDGYAIEDLGSKHGTFVNGRPVKQLTRLDDQAVIRTGRVVFVFYRGIGNLVIGERADNYQLIGKFHAPTVIREVAESTVSDRPLLLSGPSGSGKELVARAYATMLDRPMVIQNAARFSTVDEATASLFGVQKDVFTDVKERTGFIQEADGGVLFLDEAHMLPKRVQKSLLRIIEDAELANIGEAHSHKVDVRFVFASNEPGPTCGLAHDLFARLRVIALPPLKERVADIPSIFDHLLRERLEQTDKDPKAIFSHLSTTHYEQLMLDGFEQANVRGLVDIVDKIVTRIAAGIEPEYVIDDFFVLRYGRKDTFIPPTMSQSSSVKDTVPADARATAEFSRPYNIPIGHLLAIEKAYKKHGGNVTAIHKELNKQGIRYARRKIAGLLDEMDLPRVKRTKKS